MVSANFILGQIAGKYYAIYSHFHEASLFILSVCFLLLLPLSLLQVLFGSYNLCVPSLSPCLKQVKVS